METGRKREGEERGGRENDSSEKVVSMIMKWNQQWHMMSHDSITAAKRTYCCVLFDHAYNNPLNIHNALSS